MRVVTFFSIHLGKWECGRKDNITTAYISRLAPLLPRFTVQTNTSSQIIHNPGTIPDPQFLTSSSSNISVVFEGSYASYNQDTTSSSISAFQKSSKVGRERMAAIVYDFPDGQKTKDFVRQLRKVVGSLFLTGSGVDGDVYAGWWEAWQSWVGEM